jgi:uncharacterized protein (DUF58 family)
MSRRYHVHLPGVIFLIVTLLVGYAAMQTQRNLLFWVFGVMAASLLLSGVVSGSIMMSLEIRRLDPRHGAVGEPLFLRYAVTNRSRVMPVFSIHIEERPATVRRSWRLRRARPAADAGGGERRTDGTCWSGMMAPARAWIMHIGPRETVHGEAVYWPARRGKAAFDRVRVWTTFPFGIVKKSVTLAQPQHTLIYPRLYELKPRVLAALSPQGALGMRITQHSGGGDDYFGMREYRSGDSLRHVSWKRTARLDELVTIERTRPSPPRLRLVLNLLTPTERLRVAPGVAGGQRGSEEKAISLAASLVHAADLAGFEIGLAVLGLDVPAIPIRRSAWHVARLLAALAALDLDQPREQRAAGRAATETEADRAAMVVVHPDRVDPGLGRGEAWHLTAAQLDGLAVRPIGWERLAAALGGSAPAGAPRVRAEEVAA